MHGTRAARSLLATRLSAAPTVAGWLAGDVPGRVHSVFRAAVNIATPGGLVTLAPPDAGGLANGILVELGSDARALGLLPGMAVVPSATALAIAAVDLEVRLSDAPSWSPRLVPAAGPRVAAARWRARSETAWRHARLTSPRGGLRPLLWDQGANGHPRERRADGPVTWIHRAETGITDVTEALGRHDRLRAASAARGLLGLGEGLTPSGDDALVGIESALRALDHPLAGFLVDALDDVDTRTTAVAASLLRQAAIGEFAERLHGLIHALTGPADETVPGSIAHAVSWGASSGTDCLVGVLRGLDAITGDARARRRTA